MKIKKMIMIVLLAVLTAPVATHAEALPRIAVLDFYVLERIPYDYLKDAVVPEGGDFIAAERLGMTIAMREILHSMIEDVPGYKLRKLKSLESLADDVDLVFKYYIESDDPTAFFDRTLLAKLAGDLRADALIIGLVKSIKYENNPRELSAKKARLKIVYMIYNAPEDKFDYVETMDMDSDNVGGFADAENLPGGKYAEDIKKFANSEPGRVFIASAKQFIVNGLKGEAEELLSSEHSRTEDIAQNAVSHRGRPGTFDTDADMPRRPETSSPEPDAGTVPSRPTGDSGTSSGQPGAGRTSAPPPQQSSPASGTHGCIYRGQSIITSVAHDNRGLRIYRCDNGSYNLRFPYMETGRVVSSRKGISGIDTGDLDGDGLDEIIVSSYERGENIRVYKMADRGLNADNPFYVVHDVIPNANLQVYAAAGDFDGDGIDELAVSTADAADQTLVFNFVEGRLDVDMPIFDISDTFGEPGYGAFVTSGDFDGDGVDELVISSDGGGEMINVYKIPHGDQTTGVETATLRSFFGNITSSVSVAAGDFDMDGKDELAVGAFAPGINIKVFKYKDGAFDVLNPMADIHADTGVSSGGTRVFAGDYNGDRQDDLALSVQGTLWIAQYRRGRFFLSPPYIDEVELYPDARGGIFAVTGRFEKE